MNAHADIPPRPTCPPFHGLPNLPAINTLRTRRQWVAWEYFWKADLGKWDKPPINPATGRWASHSKPETWGSYSDAEHLAFRKKLDGVGYVLAPGDDITGFDLDDCREPERGVLSPLAAKVIALAETYAEISPSGRGIRLFGLGKVVKTTKCDPAGVEIYGTQRYLTLTGHHLPDTPTDIRPAPKTLALLLDHVAKVEAIVAAEKERIAKAAAAAAHQEGGNAAASAAGAASGSKNPFWRNVNDRAFANLGAWIPVLFPQARYQPGTGGYRVTSKALGRELEEDLSITKDGCVDFGVADQGDGRLGRRDAISLVMMHGGAPKPRDAAFWLCERLGVAPESLGWQERKAAADTGARATEGSADWPEPKPLPAGLLPVMAFDPEMIPAAIGPWVMDIADRMQCPPDFVAVSAVVALSSVLGRKIAVRPQARTDWTEVPNLWGCIVGRPGAMKSPAMAEAMKPLNRFEAQARETNDAAMKSYEREKEAHEIRKDAAKRAARSGKGDGGLSDLDAPDKPPAKRFICNDATYEALGEILEANPNGVLAFRDELISLLKTLDREENAAARGFFLTAWNGTTGYTFDRIMRGITHIDAACVSLLGSTQPGRLADYIGRAVKGTAGDDGLIQRFSLLVWPDDVATWREVDRYPDSQARHNAWSAFTRLHEICPSSVGAEQSDFDKLPFLRLGESARETFGGWRADLEARLRTGGMHAALESHLAKYRKLVPSLALLNHLADGGSGSVSEVAMLRGLSLAEYLESHARRAYGSGLQVEASTAKAILARIRKGDIKGEFTARDIQRKDWSNLTDKDQISAGLEVLDDLHWVRSRKTDTGGRPKVLFTVNPRAAA